MSRATEIGQDVLRQESQALTALAESLGDSFEKAVAMLLSRKGRIATCGVGKSGHIARKTAGTLSSTGAPAFFLHAAEAVHGDLGMIGPGDIVLLYTHSGETDEIVQLFPALREAQAQTILITGRPNSSAGRLADLVLNTGVLDEACTHNLAPTTSTTAMLALSDALAIAVMELSGFAREDFARLHPSGSLGKRLLLRVEDVMRPMDDAAIVSPEDTVLSAMKAMTTAGVGAACVVGRDGELIGLVSDGDLRRHLMTGSVEALAGSIMTTGPLTIEKDLLAIEALEVFQNYPKKIGEAPVVSGEKVVGLLVLKDLLRSGIV